MNIKKLRRYRSLVALVLALSMSVQIAQAMMKVFFQVAQSTPALMLVSKMFSPLIMRPSQVQLSRLLEMVQVGKKTPMEQATTIVEEAKAALLDDALPKKLSAMFFYKNEPLVFLTNVSPEQNRIDTMVANIVGQMHEKLASRNAGYETRRLWKIAARGEHNRINVANDVKMRQNPAYCAEQLRLFDSIVTCLWDTLKSDPLMQREALYKLYFMPGLEGRLGQYYLNLLNKLAPLAFNTNGSPKDLTEYNKQAPRLIAALLEYVCGDQAAYLNKLACAQKNGAQGLGQIIAQAGNASSNREFSFLEKMPEVSKLHMAIYNNPQTYHVLTLNSLCRDGKFDQAETYIRSKVNKADQPICRQIYASLYKKVYNEYGIARAYEKDPLWESMAIAEKKACKADKAQQDKINQILQARAVCKAGLEKLFNIPVQHPISVDSFLYDFIAHTGSHEEIISFLSTLHNDLRLKENSDLCALFFNNNGIVKIWEPYASVFNELKVPVNLNASRNAQLRTLANAVLLLEPTEQNSAPIKRCLKYIHAATVTEGSLRERHSTYATQLFTALVKPNQNNIILDCPDLSQQYVNRTQVVIQDFIAQRISQVMQCTDPKRREKFVNEELPMLKMAQRCNYRPQSFNDVCEQFLPFLNRLCCDSASPLNQELYDLFFTKEGLLKIFEDKRVLSSVGWPQNLGYAKNADLRHFAHALLAIETTEQNLPHIQQAFRYLEAAESALGAMRSTYRQFAGAIHTALTNPTSNPIILHAPDCSNNYKTAGQKVVQEKIIQEIRAGLQLTDKKDIADFIQKTIPALQQKHQSNVHDYMHPIHGDVLSPNHQRAADIIAKNESAGSGNSQQTQQSQNLPPAPGSPEDPDDDKKDKKSRDERRADISQVTNLHESLGDPTKIQKILEKCKDIPGAKQLIITVLAAQKGAVGIQDKLGNARGALFELYKGVSEMAQTGSTIVRFGERIKKTVDKLYDFEYDVVTATKLIECKNWDIFSNRRFEALMEGINNRRMVAELAGKAFELCFSKPIPKEAAEKIIETGIKYTITEMKL